MKGLFAAASAAFLLLGSAAVAVPVVDAAALKAWIDANSFEPTTPPTPPQPTAAAPSWSPTGWTVVFNDEFNDLSKWTWNWLGAAGTITKPVNSAELAAYDPANCSVANGILQMRAERRTVTASNGVTYQYATCGGTTSGKLPDSVYGAYEARILFPGPTSGASYNFGAWWLNGRHLSWPDRGENDIVETLSSGLRWHYHWKPSGGSDINRSGGNLNGGNGWHTYGVEWTSTLACYYYDGAAMGCATVSDGNGKYLVLDYGVTNGSPGGPQVVPATMQVDWVRVWRR